MFPIHVFKFSIVYINLAHCCFTSYNAKKKNSTSNEISHEGYFLSVYFSL